MSSAPRAIVTDGLWRKSLSAIRSLGKSGFDVTVLGDSLFTTGYWSRYTAHRVRSPAASVDANAFGQTLLRLAEQHPRSVLLPMEDASLRWVSEHRNELLERGSRFVIPSTESLAIAWDKARTIQAAQSLGLPCPRTWEPNTAAEFIERIRELEPGTFVTKPRSGSGSAGVTYGEKRDDAAWQTLWDQNGAMVIQERIPATGQGQGVSVLMNGLGKCIAAFAHERLHQYPNSGGPSTDRRSIHAPALVEQSVRLLEHLQWRGIAMVEWKVDPRDGVSKLMEINPRFWGSLELAVRAGLDFPTLYARTALDGPVAPVADYPADVRCRWMMPGEVLRYLGAKPEEREGVLRFVRGLPSLAEEWDSSDVSGAIACFVCTGALALNPKYWKYVQRG